MAEKKVIIRRPILLILFSVILLSLLRVRFSEGSPGELSSQNGTAASFEGTVQNVRIKDSHAELIVKTGKERVLVRIKGDFSKKRALLYDFCGRAISISGKITIPDSRRNPLCFDYRQYLRGKGIYTICETNQYKAKGGKIVYPLRNYLNVKKAEFYDYMEPYAGEEVFSMLAGLMFGETDYMDEDLLSGFRETGIAHILAVSGLHINLAYEAVSRLFKGRKRLLSDIVSLSSIYLYVILANYSVSVIRASAMTAIKIAAFYTNNRYDSVSAASIVAAIMLLFNPWLIFSSGLWLSFTASYIMSIVLPYVKTKTAQLSDRIKSEHFYVAAEFMAPGITVFLGTQPLIRYYYLMSTPAGIITGPLVLGLAGILLPFALASFILLILLPKAFLSFFMYLAASFMNIPCKAIKKICLLGELLQPKSECAAPPLGGVVLFYIFFFFYFSETRFILHRKNKYLALSVLEASLLIGMIVFPKALGYTDSLIPWSYNNAVVTFVDVGQGDCIHINTGKYNILIDGGGSYYTNTAENTLKPYLLKNGITRIDLAIITHEDADHSKGIYELAESFDVRYVLTNKDVYGDIGLDENDSCITAMLSIDGIRILLMSDADILREDFLISSGEDVSCDIIKLGHHGSKYSTGKELILSSAPSFAVISVGSRNTYGHPSSRVIELLHDSGIIYGRTDECGALSLRRIRKDHFCIVNASKENKWLIPRHRAESIPQEQ